MWIKEQKDVGMQKELLNTRTHTVTMLSLQFIKQYDIERLRRQIQTFSFMHLALIKAIYNTFNVCVFAAGAMLKTS